jgi:hypothetical protein
MKKSFIHCDFVRIRVMSRVCWWWFRSAGTSAWGKPRRRREKVYLLGKDGGEKETVLLRFERQVAW